MFSGTCKKTFLKINFSLQQLVRIILIFIPFIIISNVSCHTYSALLTEFIINFHELHTSSLCIKLH